MIMTFGAAKKPTTTTQSATGAKTGCYATATGMADDSIAAIFGCPDCPGMASISGPYHFFCYWIKRPMGKIAIVGGIIGLFYMFKGGHQ